MRHCTFIGRYFGSALPVYSDRFTSSCSCSSKFADLCPRKVKFRKAGNAKLDFQNFYGHQRSRFSPSPQRANRPIPKKYLLSYNKSKRLLLRHLFQFARYTSDCSQYMRQARTVSTHAVSSADRHLRPDIDTVFARSIATLSPYLL